MIHCFRDRALWESTMRNSLAKWGMPALCLALLLAVAGLAWLMITQMVSKDVQLVIDGKVSACETTSYTVEELLEEQKIQLVKEDSITPKVDQTLTDGAKVEITKAVPFTVRADGESKDLKALPRTVADALDDHHISVGEADKVVPALSEPLTAGTEIVINRITTQTQEVMEPVDFKTKTKGDNDLPAGTTEVVKKGKKGQDKVTYQITYSDGQEIDRQELERERLKKPVAKVIAKSTRGMIHGAEYVKKITVKAYSYTGGGRTASGTRARVGEIAVDPRVIPLGTNVYVEGYGFARAEDTGGNIKGNTIDVYKNSESACLNWGVRHVTVYILSK
ncbi:DUF348 domain-containing protein [Clostridiales bacterium]|nr:DUF348 domain-containing protein [Clostridiales bacterium]